MDYDMAFLFAYSSRDRTPAARRLVDDVPEAVKKKRLAALIDAFRAGRARRAAARVGATELILVEGAPPRRPRGRGGVEELVAGRCDAGRRVVFPAALPDGSALGAGDFAHVLVDHVDGATAFGVALRRADGARDRPDASS